MPGTRLVSTSDAGGLAELLVRNRRFLAPWSPLRAESFYTEAGQRRAIGEALERHRRGEQEPRVILDDGRIVGRISLSTIVRGPFQSCNLGYWVSEPENGRGLATAAVGEIMSVAFRDLALHRIEAGTIPANLASQRVLERNGFARFGLAPLYLKIAGRWQDHVLYQALSPG